MEKFWAKNRSISELKILIRSQPGGLLGPRAQDGSWAVGWLHRCGTPVNACDPALAQNRGNDLGRAYYSMYIYIIYIINIYIIYNIYIYI